MPQWTPTREWDGETCFIVGGGPSVLKQRVELLRGCRTIVINSTYNLIPWADICFFGDTRFGQHYEKDLRAFPGRVVTCAPGISDFALKLGRKTPPPALSLDPRQLIMGRTSTQAAINLAFHLGVRRIVLLGIDQCTDTQGRTHHHGSHPWPTKVGAWRMQSETLKDMVGPLKTHGVEVLNASPTSLLTCWPKVDYEEVVSDPSFRRQCP